MSTTRHAAPDAPLSQERYMSSPEFSGLNGINGLAVAKRCALLTSRAKRELLWFLQGISLQKGVNWLADEILRLYPERVETATMLQLGAGKDKYSAFDAAIIRGEIYETCETDVMARQAAKLAKFPGSIEDLLGDGEFRPDSSLAPAPPVAREALLAECRREAKQRLPRFLTELCINPGLKFAAPGEQDSSEAELQLLQQQVGDHVLRVSADEGYFDDIIGALFDFKRRYEEQARAAIYLTAIGKKIWKQLDDALAMGTMGLVEGLEGRGKTVAAEVWCNCHLGVARYISLKGISTKTAQFRALAAALGLGHGSSRKSTEMQAGVEEVLRLSGLMTVIDEAHFFFNQAPRVYTRPEMLDWIDTALCNPPLPVTLITTPQFRECIKRTVVQVGWNYRQFERRCKRYTRLPAKNTPEDVEGVIRWLIPGADNATIQRVVAYQLLAKRDLSGVGDIVREAKMLAKQEGSNKVREEHVVKAWNEVLAPSNVPWSELRKEIEAAERKHKNKKGNGTQATAPAPIEDPAVEPAETQEPEEVQQSGSRQNQALRLGQRGGQPDSSSRRHVLDSEEVTP